MIVRRVLDVLLLRGRPSAPSPELEEALEEHRSAIAKVNRVLGDVAELRRTEKLARHSTRAAHR